MSNTDPSALDTLLDHRILVLCGTGGVGKTSVSASLAILAANRGKRVLVMTIDPSKRLAQTFGMDLNSDRIKELSETAWRFEAKPPPQKGAKATKRPGTLSGMILNPKKVFDEVIRRHAKSAEESENILNNPIYQHLSSILAGSQEYMAMEKLLEITRSKERYDLIILDTPPSEHALDFLDAPERMIRAISDSALKYFLKPGLLLGRSGFHILRRGPKALFSFLDRIAGVSFLEEVSEMLILAEGLLEGFKDRAEAVESLLRDTHTGFCMVTTLSPWAIHDAKIFHASLAKKDVHLVGVFLNRATPHFTWNLSPKEEKAIPEDVLQAGKTAYTNYHALFEDERAQEQSLVDFLKKEKTKFPVWKLPLLRQEVHDLDTLKVMALSIKSTQGI